MTVSASSAFAPSFLFTDYSMPISVDQYAARLAHRTPAEAFGRPARPLAKDKILKLLE